MSTEVASTRLIVRFRVVAAYTGVWIAVVIVSACFGGAHAYQGAKGAVKAAAVGAVMSGIVLASGWLIPAMVVHALMDIAGGVIAFRLNRREPPGACEPSTVVVPA